MIMTKHEIRVIIVSLALIVVFTCVNQYKQHELSTIPVSGTILAVWEAEKSDTLLYQVGFDYGVDTIEGRKIDYKAYKVGDTYTSYCEYTLIIGCNGFAYTGYVDSIWGEFNLAFTIIQIASVFFFGLFLYLLFNHFRLIRRQREPMLCK